MDVEAPAVAQPSAPLPRTTDDRPGRRRGLPNPNHHLSVFRRRKRRQAARAPAGARREASAALPSPLRQPSARHGAVFALGAAALPRAATPASTPLLDRGSGRSAAAAPRGARERVLEEEENKRADGDAEVERCGAGAADPAEAPAPAPGATGSSGDWAKMVERDALRRLKAAFRGWRKDAQRGCVFDVDAERAFRGVLDAAQREKRRIERGGADIFDGDAFQSAFCEALENDGAARRVMLRSTALGAEEPFCFSARVPLPTPPYASAEASIVRPILRFVHEREMHRHEGCSAFAIAVRVFDRVSQAPDAALVLDAWVYVVALVPHTLGP